MKRFTPIILLPLLLLSACEQDLHLKVRFAAPAGLVAGDPVAADNQPVGTVESVEPSASGELVAITIDRQRSGLATSATTFLLDEDPNTPNHKRIALEQSRPDGKPLEDGSTVEGKRRGGLESFPFGALIQKFGDLLQNLSGEIEQFGKQFEKLPDSDEARAARKEWENLLEQWRQAQNSAEGTLRDEVAPRLKNELDRLRERLESLQRQPAPAKPGKPIEI